MPLRVTYTQTPNHPHTPSAANLTHNNHHAAATRACRRGARVRQTRASTGRGREHRRGRTRARAYGLGRAYAGFFFVGGESLTGPYTLATMSSEDTRATPPWRVALELFATILVWAGVWEVLSQIGAFHTVSRSLVIAGSGILVLVILGYSRTPQEA